MDLDKKEAIKALQRNTTQDVQVDSEQGAPIVPYSPFVMLMIRAAYKSRELPYDSHDVTLVNKDGLGKESKNQNGNLRWHLP